MPLARARTDLAVLGLIGSLVACEPRVEEPLPPAQPDPAGTTAGSSQGRAPAPSASTGAVATAADSAGKARCVRPSPPEPARKVTLEGKFDPKCPADPEKPPKLRSGKATFTDSKDQTVTVEITDNDHDRQRGLMYRKSMADDHGMIFVFDQKEDHSFWMKNTCIPLDMLYIDDDGLIVGIEENTPTLSESTFSVGCESKYVLEMNAGWTRKHGVKAGQRVKLDL
jgi:uncharacterized membrane protein (UPF0127 family)